MLISYLLLFTTLFLLNIKKIYTGIVLLAVQSLLIAINILLYGLPHANWHLFILVFLVIVFKVVLVPFILHQTMIKINIKREAEKLVSRTTAFLLGLALLISSSVVAERLSVNLPLINRDEVSVALGMILIGAFTMIVHKKAIMQGVGLITIENGVFVFSLALTNGIPFMVEFGIFFDLLILVVIIGIFSYRIHSTFASLNIDKLQNLRG